jgi:hypothetical protein
MARFRTAKNDSWAIEVELFWRIAMSESVAQEFAIIVD